MVELVPARDLEPGCTIYLSDDCSETVRSVEFADNQFIVGGPYNKTAAAVRITTNVGTSFLVHPGQLVGVIKGG